jgi:hypothetical protein
MVSKAAPLRRGMELPTPEDGDVARASALVMGWNLLGEHYARGRDRRNCPPQSVIDDYLDAAVEAADA